ncbi:MAG: enoyl-CoA hydratase/isomerase family protein [Planctomycetes bacterium]|nr:enoyl-CoA hydratase/isomerase family protein [Planctomycetota bacterium]
MTDRELVLLERDGPVAWLTLNRPEARNALSLPTLLRLRVLLAELRRADDVWVVALTGAGDKAFCAGADLKERRGLSEDQVRQFVQQIRGTMDDLAALPQPTVAVMNGHAFGGGCEMALACDLRVLDRGAMIGLTETSLAIIPGAGGCVRLPRLIGSAKAKELILMARRLEAREAEQLGLVNFLAPPGGARSLGQEIVSALLRNGPLALRAAKAAIDGSLDLPVASALEHEFACYQRILPTEDRLEALAAFGEKRPARFRGR